MMNPFQGISDLKKMRDQAMQIQKMLSSEQITVEKHGIRIVITGDQRILAIETNGKSDDNIREAVNEAVKKSQEIAAKKLATMQGGLGGLLGGK